MAISIDDVLENILAKRVDKHEVLRSFEELSEQEKNRIVVGLRSNIQNNGDAPEQARPAENRTRTLKPVHEMNLSEERQQRGIPFPVRPRDQVMARAVELAQTLAEKPRNSLVTLKEHLNAPLRESLRSMVAQEVAMHAVTFAQPEVKSRIATLSAN